MRIRRTLLLGVAVIALFGAVPAHAGPKPAFTSWQETFVDSSRPTAAGAATPAAPHRTLATTLYRPKGKGPFPVIVFAHGSSGHPDKFTQLLGRWAAAGYIVAAPAFPLTNSSLPQASANAGDVVNQPADVTFVLTQVLHENRDRTSKLFHSIDRRHLGAAGLSLGGATTYLAVFGDCCRDARFTSAMVLDGFLPGDGARLDGHVPLLIAHSDTDPAIPYGTARGAYDAAQSPVWLLTFHGASHASQWENDPTPYDAIGEAVTTDFWDATLRGKKAAPAGLVRDATVEGLSSIESRP